MQILAIDVGARTGLAWGDSAGQPQSEALVVRKRKDSHEKGAANLACALDELIKRNRPDLIAVENFLNPVLQRSADVIVSQLLSHGAVEAVAALHKIRLERPSVSSIRTHFIAQTTVRPRGSHRTPRQKQDDRVELNTIIVSRAIMLGYLERDSTDFDRANALAVFDYAAAHYARRIPRELVLFGEGRVNAKS